MRHHRRLGWVVTLAVLPACGGEAMLSEGDVQVERGGIVNGSGTTDTFAGAAFLFNTFHSGDPHSGVLVTNQWVVSTEELFSEFVNTIALGPTTYPNETHGKSVVTPTLTLRLDPTGATTTELWHVDTPFALNGTSLFHQIYYPGTLPDVTALTCYDAHSRFINVVFIADTQLLQALNPVQSLTSEDDGDPCYLTNNVHSFVGVVRRGKLLKMPRPSFLPRIYRGAPANFDGDPQTSIAVFRPSNGTWYIQARPGISSGQTVAWGLPGDVPVAADYDGDYKADIAVWRPSNGTWYVRGIATQQWGISGDIPVPADYDGDEKADFAVWRPSNGTWYILQSSNGQMVSKQWGLLGDTPVPACYDSSDAKADFAVWRPSNGTWYIFDSSTGIPRAIQFGLAGDAPIPMAYMGVFSPAVRRGNQVLQMGESTITVGNTNDVPVTGDFDNDGFTDVGSFSRLGIWSIVTHNGVSSAVQWGLAGDSPATVVRTQ